MTRFNCLDPSTQIKGHHFLQASAGTGKTFAIEHLVTRQILEGIPLKAILVVTFTRSAARELRMRIDRSLRHALTCPDFPYVKQALKQNRSANLYLETALLTIEEADILTLHSFCHRMLHTYHLETGLAQPETGDQFLTSKGIDLYDCVHDFFRRGLHPLEFDDAQLEPLVRAKTPTVVSQLVQILGSHHRLPSLPDFATSCAQFLKVKASLPPLSLALYDRLQPFFKGLTRRREGFQILIDTHNRETISALLRQPPILPLFEETNRNRKTIGSSPQVDDLAQIRLHHQRLSPILFQACDPSHTLLRLASACRRSLDPHLDSLLQTYPDLLLKKMASSLMRPPFLEAVRKRYETAIIDEFQDTDPLQWKIFKTLFIDQPIPTLYLVGDPKQAIYSFRGADLPSYLAAAQEVHSHKQLLTNYRSEPTLLTLLNQLFTLNPDFISSSHPLPYQPVEIDPQASDSRLLPRRAPLHLLEVTQSAHQRARWPSTQVEAELLFPFIAQEILLLRQAHPSLSIAVLIKDRRQGHRIKKSLEQVQILVTLQESEPLFRSPVYDLMLSLLYVIQQPTRALRFASHPLLGIPHTSLKDPLEQQRLRSACLSLANRFQTGGLPAMLTLLLHHPWHRNGTILEALILEHGSLQLLEDFHALLQLLLAHTQSGRKSLSDLLQFLKQLPQEASHAPNYLCQPPFESDAVQLLTVYKSKGLEFDVVFALGLASRYRGKSSVLIHNECYLPLNPDEPRSQKLLEARGEEKMRELYVGLTRAKKRLYLPLITPLDKRPLPPPQEASPLELFFAKLPPLSQLLSQLPLSHQKLEQPLPHPAPAHTTLALISPTSPPSTPPASGGLFSFSSLKRRSDRYQPRLPLSPLILDGDTPRHSTLTIDLPPGPDTGTYLHTIFESLLRFRQLTPTVLSLTDQIEQVVHQTLIDTPLNNYTQQVTTLVDHAMRLPLARCSLSQLPPHHIQVEVEFLFQEGSDYLKGFIDLIFSCRGDYYLVDWKSNQLPSYDPVALATAMEANRYTQQASIYYRALTKHLDRARTPSGKNPSIRGAFYLFLRGLPRGEGVVFLSNQQLEQAYKRDLLPSHPVE